MTNKIKKRYNRIAKFYDILDKPMEMAASGWREKFYIVKLIRINNKV